MVQQKGCDAAIDLSPRLTLGMEREKKVANNFCTARAVEVVDCDGNFFGNIWSGGCDFINKKARWACLAVKSLTAYYFLSVFSCVCAAAT